VRIPAATGEILTGLQAALQTAVLVMVVSEMLGSGVGLGAFIIRAQSTFMIADMWLGILILGALGVILNGAFHLIEKRLFPWYFASKAIK
jgi:ABC-type nitrate/sulfonate/bicarbonate transport system permease component